MFVCRTVSEIFSVEEWRDLETEGRGRSRSLKMAPFDRSYTTFYWSATVSIAVGYVVPFSSYLTLNNHDLEKVTECQTSTIRKPGCGFLFVFYGNYGRIFNRLWDIQRQRIAWPWKLGGAVHGLVVGHRTCDLVVAGSRPGRDAAA